MRSGWAVLVAALAVCVAGQADDLHKGREAQDQLQPAKYNNNEHSGLNFFEFEALYVEDDRLLVWQPLTGKWALHEIARDCETRKDCGIVSDAPLLTGEWPQWRFHKMTFMGCHPTTGRGHMMIVDATTGVYKIHLFDALNAEKDPMGEEVAGHQRLEMTQFGIAYVGQDEMMMHDGLSSEFRIYLIEPKMPVSKGVDPVFPFDPLVSGKLDQMKEQMVYLGNGVLLSYSPSTGDYAVFAYNRRASRGQPPLSQPLSEGSILKGQQLTYIGQNQILAINTDSGEYSALSLDPQHATFLKHPVRTYGFGTFALETACFTQETCGACLKRKGCGWCATDESCRRGVGTPCLSNCTNYEAVCPGEPCHTHRGCSSCISDPFCGWCGDTETCVEGAMGGPLFGQCEYFKLSCPSRPVKALVPGIPCSSEIQ